MKQVMNYIEEPINYENRLRYIAANVISLILINNFEPKLKIGEFNDDTYADAMYESEYDSKTKNVSVQILIDNNIDKLYKNNITDNKNLDIFLTNVPDNLHPIATWIFILLHEVGHVIFIDDIISIEGHDALFRSNNYNELSRKLLETVITVNTISKQNYCYFNSAAELYADNFAYNSFYFIWNTLISRGLI